MGTNVSRILDRIPTAVISSAKMAYSVGAETRQYHNWEHVLDVLGYVAQVNWDHPTEAVLAAIFHDAVYVVGDVMNEYKSSDLFKDTWKTFVNPYTFGSLSCDISLVCRMIEATAFHLDPLNARIVNAPTEVLRFMDCDMAGLGLPFVRFNQASKRIEDECLPSMGPQNFLHGRKRFWEKLMARPLIFHTKDFAHLEWQARKNIHAEMTYLKQGISPSGMSLL